MPRRLLAPLVAALAMAALAGCQSGALAPDDGAPSTTGAASDPSAQPEVALPPMPQLCAELDAPGTAAAAEAAGFGPSAQEWQSSGDVWEHDVELPQPALTCAWMPAGAGDEMVLVELLEVDAAQLEAWEASSDWSSTRLGDHEVRAAQQSDGATQVQTTWAAADGRMLRLTAIDALATGTALAEVLVPAVLG
ncbi:hypothetical protein [Agrococcus sp. SGAir0287]|uniref:hypothetical protein n=1 Tax=Agrococcus sp. SGAir0287 TaxID=2070347 RepID=UPI0010CCC2DA|nr:hypothetical protein [Agrococcus sp. SGAir0287]QCR19954.1 hypothetical protein C1N71_11350 [Agrococcus sp. SGAir0287]